MPNLEVHASEFLLKNRSSCRCFYTCWLPLCITGMHILHLYIYTCILAKFCHHSSPTPTPRGPTPGCCVHDMWYTCVVFPSQCPLAARQALFCPHKDKGSSLTSPLQLLIISELTAQELRNWTFEAMLIPQSRTCKHFLIWSLHLTIKQKNICDVSFDGPPWLRRLLR